MIQDRRILRSNNSGKRNSKNLCCSGFKGWVEMNPIAVGAKLHECENTSPLSFSLTLMMKWMRKSQDEMMDSCSRRNARCSIVILGWKQCNLAVFAECHTIQLLLHIIRYKEKEHDSKYYVERGMRRTNLLEYYFDRRNFELSMVRYHDRLCRISVMVKASATTHYFNAMSEASPKLRPKV